jgi:hypothetical protein
MVGALMARLSGRSGKAGACLDRGGVWREKPRYHRGRAGRYARSFRHRRVPRGKIVRLGEEKAMRDITIFVHAHGGGTSRAVRIFNQETSIIGLYLLLPPVWLIDAPFLFGLIDYFRC